MIKYAVVSACFIVFDVVTGFIKALAQKNVDSTILRKGLFHKLSEIAAIAFSMGCEYALQFINIGFNLPMVIAVCSYIILMESISILENIISLNPRLGKFLQKYLKKLKGAQDENDSETD